MILTKRAVLLGLTVFYVGGCKSSEAGPKAEVSALTDFGEDKIDLTTYKATPQQIEEDFAAVLASDYGAIFRGFRKGAFDKKLQSHPELSAVSAEELIGLRYYSSSGSADLNAALRSSRVSEREKWGPMIRLISSALNKMPPYVGTVVRTGNPPQWFIDSLKVGEVVTIPAFLSTSIHPHWRFNKSHRVVYHVVSETGADIAFLSQFAEENEVLFPPGAEFFVESKELRPGGQFVFKMIQVVASRERGLAKLRVSRLLNLASNRMKNCTVRLRGMESHTGQNAVVSVSLFGADPLHSEVVRSFPVAFGTNKNDAAQKIAASLKSRGCEIGTPEGSADFVRQKAMRHFEASMKGLSVDYYNCRLEKLKIVGAYQNGDYIGELSVRRTDAGKASYSDVFTGNLYADHTMPLIYKTALMPERNYGCMKKRKVTPRFAESMTHRRRVLDGLSKKLPGCSIYAAKNVSRNSRGRYTTEISIADLSTGLMRRLRSIRLSTKQPISDAHALILGELASVYPEISNSCLSNKPLSASHVYAKRFATFLQSNLIGCKVHLSGVYPPANASGANRIRGDFTIESLGNSKLTSMVLTLQTDRSVRNVARALNRDRELEGNLKRAWCGVGRIAF